MIIWSAKDPAATEKFEFDFSLRLGSDTISGDPTLVGDGVTVVSHQVTDGTKVDLELAGGTAGTIATVSCTIVTAGGETLVDIGVVPIGGEAVDLSTAKAAQRIEDSSEDVLLAGMLRAAVGAVERITAKNLTAKIETQVLAGFPRRRRAYHDHCFPLQAQGLAVTGSESPVRFFRGPVSQILSVDYDDPTGVTQTLASFRLVEGGLGQAQLLPAYGQFWPETARGPGTVRISYVAGYDPAGLPPELTQAAILLFGHFNANREAVLADLRAAAVELPLGVEMLISPYCSPGIA